MDFVYDIDFEPCPCRSVNCVLSQFANLVDAVVCSTINLDDIDIFAEIDCDTTFTLAARVSGGGIDGESVKSFSEDAGHSCFTDTSGTSKQVGVGDPVGFDGVFEGLCDWVLSDDLIECLGPVFSC